MPPTSVHLSAREVGLYYLKGGLVNPPTSFLFACCLTDSGVVQLHCCRCVFPSVAAHTWTNSFRSLVPWIDLGQCGTDSRVRTWLRLRKRSRT